MVLIHYPQVCNLFGFFYEGVEFQSIPDTNGVPLVADMSSNILSRKIDVSKVLFFISDYVGYLPSYFPHYLYSFANHINKVYLI